MAKTAPSLVIMTVVAALTACPVLAQQASTVTPPVPSASAPAGSGGVVATTNNPNLAVSTVKLENGTRASKIIGAAVYNDGSERVGSVDDLIMTRDDRITMAIVSVGGFLGLGSKLVAVPWSQLRMDADKIVMPGVTKDGLNGMPSFTYGS